MAPYSKFESAQPMILFSSEHLNLDHWRHNPLYLPNTTLRILSVGGFPPPLTDKIRKVVFEGLPYIDFGFTNAIGLAYNL